MTGSRPLTDSEIARILSALPSPRDRAMVLIGIRAGFRISEILSLTVASITEYGRVGSTITVLRRDMKGKQSSRTVPLHPQAQAGLTQLLISTPKLLNNPQNKLFPFTRQHASRIFKQATAQCWIGGRVTTHSMRKTFASKVHKALGENIYKTQQAMGHKLLSSTAHYLSFNEDEISNAIVGAT